MTSLYQMVYAFFGNIMNTNTELSAATELVAICVTIAITYFIVLSPAKLLLEIIFRRKKKQ